MKIHVLSRLMLVVLLILIVTLLVTWMPARPPRGHEGQLESQTALTWSDLELPFLFMESASSQVSGAAAFNNQEVQRRINNDKTTKIYKPDPYRLWISELGSARPRRCCDRLECYRLAIDWRSYHRRAPRPPHQS